MNEVVDIFVFYELYHKFKFSAGNFRENIHLDKIRFFHRNSAKLKLIDAQSLKAFKFCHKLTEFHRASYLPRKCMCVVKSSGKLFPYFSHVQ